jgi:hypothetical protein
MANIFGTILNNFHNTVLNTTGVQRDLDQLLRDLDVSRARGLMQDRDADVREAIAEYNPDDHKVMKEKRYKIRDGKDAYEYERLPRPWQRFINEVALFFLLGNPIKWQNDTEVADGATDPTEEAFVAFEELLKSIRFHATMREAKRLAGAETESAILFHIYRNDETFTSEVKALVIAKSKGYTLRPLFDQYGNMLAFGYGYQLKDGNNTIEHFDVQTADTIYNCTKGRIGWNVDITPNPTGKINVIYCQQNREWDGVQRRIERDEKTDSKTADANNYFATPKLIVDAEALESLPDSTKVAGEVILLRPGANGNTSGNAVRYLEPPRASEEYKIEKEALKQSILQDSLTPDFSYENLKGTGTLSGEAMRRQMILGYMKRDNLLEIYEPLVDRAKNLILAIMANVTHIRLRSQIERLEISFEFAEPFNEDASARTTETGNAYANGTCSLETAVRRIGFVGDVDEEIARIQAEKAASNEENIFGRGVEA